MHLSLSEILLWMSAFFLMFAIFVILYFGLFSRRFTGMLSSKENKLLNDYGEFISHFTFPLFSIGGALIIYSTIVEQNEKDNINQFEKIYFKMIDVCRENRSNILMRSDPFEGEEVKGVHVFTKLYDQVWVTAREIHKKYPQINDTILADLSFSCSYTGLSSETNRIRVNSLLKKYSSLINIDTIIEHLDRFGDSVRMKNKTDVSFFIGNKTRLSTYFNEIFMSINYVLNQDNISSIKKEFYINMLVGQIGFFEKIITNLYLNSSIATKTHKNMRQYMLLNEDENLSFRRMLFIE